MRERRKKRGRLDAAKIKREEIMRSDKKIGKEKSRNHQVASDAGSAQVNNPHLGALDPFHIFVFIA